MNKNIFGQTNNENKDSYFSSNNSNYSGSKKILFYVALIIVVAMSIAAAFLFFSKYKNKNQSNQPIETEKPTATSTLPVSQVNPDDTDSGEEAIDSVKAEILSFDQFYKNPNEKYNINYDKLNLPLQVKTDVSNYYEVSRKIDFSDDNLNEINKNGFTTVNNKLSLKNNFYDTYIALVNQSIPQLVTSDFLIYYYQNLLKEIFSDIKSNTFYNDLWLINKNFFEIANSRYKQTAAKTELANDPVLEGQRLEAAYFATALELLRVKPEQIDYTNSANKNKFSDKEASVYDFTLPDYLNDDVKKEVDLIYKAKQQDKSPVFRYQKDYNLYKVPKDLAENNKLKNFYLANKWVNSLFPLYYKDAKCPDCLLDKNDWLINIVANSYIAKDFNDNQNLKNRWARVYKVLSFFSGLRKDLTYLQFKDTLIGLYGNDYKIEEIFSASKGLDNALAAAIKVQAEIDKKYNFSEIEGGYKRNDAKVKPQIGMRLLQEDYWPDTFIFNQLITPNVGNYKNKIVDRLPNDNITGCKLSRQKVFTRCKAIGLDIINLYSPILNNKYFTENTAYDNYIKQSQKLSGQLKDFTPGSWHNSNYWSIMFLNKQALLQQNNQTGPIYLNNKAWQEKNINTALSAWVNLKLTNDTLGLNIQSGNNLFSGASHEAQTFVEPNLVLINELLANIKMLSSMLNELKIVKDIDVTSKKIKDAVDDLSVIKSLAIKEIQGENIDVETQMAVQSILRKYTVVDSQPKNIELSFDNSSTVESVDGVKLQVVVYQDKNKKILVVGPIFNYLEK